MMLQLLELGYREMINEINFKNGPITYTDQGKGRTIVLLHGFLESIDIWTDYANALAKRYRVIAINLPGHSSSETYGYIHTMEFMAEAVNAVLVQLSLRKVFIVGHSMGGYVALAFAEKYPDKTKGICLFHSTATADSEDRKHNRDRALALVKDNHKKFITSTIPLWFAKDNRPFYKEEIDQLKKIALTHSKRGIAAALEGMKIRIDREMVLKFSSFNVFYIIGKKDETIPYDLVKSQTTLPNDCEYLILENVGHMGFIEAKEQCLKALKKYATKTFK